MSPKRGPSNHAASARARLNNLARARGLEFQQVLSDFAIERLLYRLGISEHVDDFVLKGAMLFRLWSTERHRATWDLDLLGRGASRVADVVSVVRELCAIPAEDGIVFDLDSIAGEAIRAFDENVGVRVRLRALLTTARIPMQIDVGFGDAVTPVPIRKEYPTLVDHPVPEILVYPREAVVAEKLHVMILRGLDNSRMKDFFDVSVLASSFAFEGPVLARAISATFSQRDTSLPEDKPLVLTRTFLGAPERQTQWRAFARRGRLDASSLITNQLTFVTQKIDNSFLAY